MNFLGSLAFERCNITFLNSQISPNQNEKNQVILVDHETTFIGYNFSIDAKMINSIVLNNHSFCSLINGRISNFKIGLVAKKISKETLSNCTIQNNKKLTSPNLSRHQQNHIFEELKQISINAIIMELLYPMLFF
jgi:hypothetical protein